MAQQGDQSLSIRTLAWKLTYNILTVPAQRQLPPRLQFRGDPSLNRRPRKRECLRWVFGGDSREDRSLGILGGDSAVHDTEVRRKWPHLHRPRY